MRIRLDRLHLGSTELFRGFCRWNKTEHTLHRVRRPQLTPGNRKLRLDRDRRLELVDAGPDAISGEPVEIHDAQGVGIDGARIDWVEPVGCAFLNFRQTRGGTDLRADGIRHVGDQVEHLRRFARISLRPKMLVVPAVYQLNRHFDPAAFPKQAALDQSVDT